MEKSLLILSAEKTVQKIQRMAYEIYERNYAETEIIFLGIQPRGIILAEEVARVFKSIASVKISVGKIRTEKKNNVAVSARVEGRMGVSGKAVVIFDDVMYSGKTLFCSLSAVMQHNPKSVQLAVFVDRGHRQMPLSPDYVGLELATTLEEHVTVRFPNGEKNKKGKATGVEVFLD